METCVGRNVTLKRELTLKPAAMLKSVVKLKNDRRTGTDGGSFSVSS